MVGFQFLHTRVRGIPIPFHRNFEEVNLRFYVRYNGEDGWRRGVVFIKELVPRRAIATVARVVYGENYEALPMRHTIKPPSHADTGQVAYDWYHGGVWCGLQARFVGESAPLLAGSEQEFISEHYWGYTKQSGRTLEYRVEHPSWRIWNATEASLQCDVAALYGSQFAGPLTHTPKSAFIADGSAVSVLMGRPISGANSAA